jgi:ABC-2 type transport system ATP-binding protein
MQAIKVKNLTKEFGKLRAVNGISFEVGEGEIFGLLGPNGAGKTTTIRMLIGVLEPTNGEVYIGKYNRQDFPLKTKQVMGIVPEMANAYLDLSAIQNLLFTGALYGVARETSLKRAKELLKLFKLYGKRKQKVKTFSKGMKQRLILSMALMNDSEILFLDEPTGGLDTESVILIRDLIRKFNREGKTIFLTTHNIEEANLLCDRVAIMNYGEIVAIDRPERLKQTIQSTSSIEVAFKKAVDEEEIKIKGVLDVKKEGDKYKLYSGRIGEVIPLLVRYSEDSGNEIISLNTLGPSLEDVFLKLTQSK